MKVKKIVIVGNSAALRNRPHVKEQSLNYGQLIRKGLNTEESKILYLVESLAFGRAIMTDLHKVSDQIINSFGDLYIINMGAADAATREMSKWFANVLNQKKQTLAVKIAKFIHLIYYLPFRTILVKLRGKRAWISKSKFEKMFNELIYKIQHNTSGKIIVLSLNIPDERVEKSVPGSIKNYKVFNNILENICKEKGLPFLSFDHFKSEIDYPDGNHFSEVGNEKVANKILSLIKREKYV